MKKMGVLRLSLLFAGCFLGAGYVSGQELWQYFGSYGSAGFIGLLVAMALLCLFGILTLRLAQMSGFAEADRIIIPWDIKPLRLCVSIMETILLFCVSAVMTAGAGALLEQLFGLPHILGSFLFGAALLAAALAGLQGVVSAFSVSVPLLILATILFGVFSAVRSDFSALPQAASGSSQLLGNWFFSAVNFACYNVFGTIAVLAPFGTFMTGRRTVYAGIAGGTLALIIIAVSVLLSLRACPASAGTELPMLYVAASLSPLASYLYAVLLLAGMFGTALSTFVGLVTFFAGKFPPVAKHRKAFSIAVFLLAFAASLFGFGDLIGILYPLFGYGSAVFLVLMILHYFRLRFSSKASNPS